MPKVNKNKKKENVCEFCQFGTEVRVCGRLWQIEQGGLTVTAHHKCMVCMHIYFHVVHAKSSKIFNVP